MFLSMKIYWYPDLSEGTYVLCTVCMSVRLFGPYLNNRSIVFFQIWYEVTTKIGAKPNILGFLKKILNSEILANFGYFSCFF